MSKVFKPIQYFLYFCLGTSLVTSQHPQLPQGTPRTPSELAALILSKFTSGEAAEFAGVFPYEEGRALVAQAAKDGHERRPGIGRLVLSVQHRAVLVLSGVALTGNSGDETINSRAFSGFYEATERNGSWAITNRLPLAEKNRIRAHDVDVTITPGEGLHVTDRMQITIGDEYGFAPDQTTVRRFRESYLTANLLSTNSVADSFGCIPLRVQLHRALFPAHCLNFHLRSN